MKHLQTLAFNWATRAFGYQHVTNRRIRVLRLLEEATELAQAEGVSQETAMLCVGVVYGNPVGDPFRELGGVLMTAAVYAEGLGVQFEDVLTAELDFVLQKPTEYYNKRNENKISMGLV